MMDFSTIRIFFKNNKIRNKGIWKIIRNNAEIRLIESFADPLEFNDQNNLI